MNKLNFLCCLITLTLSLKASEEQDLYAIVGSTRACGQIVGPIIGPVLEIDQSDTTHLKTFDGQATTIDLDKSEIKNAKHLKVDASKYSFDGYRIKKVYFERLDTFYPGKEPTSNLIGDCLKNMAKKMIPYESTVEIEWHPHCTLAYFGKKTTEILNKMIQQNPFQAFLDVNLSINSVLMASTKKENLKNLPEEFFKLVEQESPRVEKLIKLYAEAGNLKIEKIKEHLVHEIEILKILLEKPNAGVVLKHYPSSELGKLKQALKELMVLDYINQDWVGMDAISLKNKILFMPQNSPDFEKIPAELKLGKIFNYQLFMQYSTFNYLLSDIAVLNQKSSVTKYMENIGFGDIAVERKTSPYNGRKNVWIVSATYKPNKNHV